MSSTNSIFLYGNWRRPSMLYVLLHGSPNPPRAITKRYHYRQATLCDDPRQPPTSGRRGASMDGVYVTGLTGAEIGTMDGFLAAEGCNRHEVMVQIICCSGHDHMKKAFVWFPSRPLNENFHSWNAGPHSRPNGGANRTAHGVNPGAAQGHVNSTFSGAADAA
ncbi:aig2-like family protein [Colletotrichum incanum]|uniref:Aig2-like family protein n=1 Tax=Colletotrichum incanum TaxID=1573173 RepID=A0A166RZN9_COLIC|nr:aig2-like family protein [Colletotrichum incanum]OHW97356.1 hypothetical protein CSPAE12_03930 [Colletotrichum incanum]